MGTKLHIRGEEFLCALPAGSLTRILGIRAFLRGWFRMTCPVLIPGFFFLILLLMSVLMLTTGFFFLILRMILPDVCETFSPELSFLRRPFRLLNVAISSSTFCFVSLNSLLRVCRDSDIGGILMNDRRRNESHKSPVTNLSYIWMTQIFSLFLVLKKIKNIKMWL